MLNINKDLLYPAGLTEEIVNFNEIYAMACLGVAKADFAAKQPLKVDTVDGYNYGGNPELPLVCGDEDPSMAVDTTYDCKLSVKGKAHAMSEEVQTALFGAGADQTHCAVVLIELPTNDPTQVKFGRDTASPATALTADDCLNINGILYVVNCIGLYEDSDTTTCATTYIALKYAGVTVKIGIDVSECELVD